MTQKPPFICLYLENISDIQNVIEKAKKAGYNRIICDIKCPQLSMHENRQSNDRTNVFTRSDLLLSAEQWRTNSILKIGDCKDCDSKDTFVWKQSNQTVKQEIEYAKHLDELACIIVPLKSDESSNLARQLVQQFNRSGCVLAEISIVDKSFFTQNYINNNQLIELSTASTVVWQRFNQFRCSIDFNQHFKVRREYFFALSFTKNLK